MKSPRAKPPAPHAPSETIAFGARKVVVTHPDRVLFPDDGITKGDLVHYYRDVAHWLLPYVTHRPLTLQRWPGGIGGFSFFEKEAPKGMPEWIATTKQPRADERGDVTYPVADDAPSLAYFANLASITLHVWMSRVESIDHPDFLLFDLDPFEECTVRTLACVALTLRDELETIGLAPLVKTTGGKGLHVVVPILPRYSYEEARAMNEIVAHRIAHLLPDAVTLERSKAKRARGTVYFDWAQLGLGRTVVPPFTVRARAGAPVSMPIAWSEVEALSASRAAGPSSEAFVRWNLGTVPALLADRGDPWHGAFTRGQALEPALEKARANAKWNADARPDRAPSKPAARAPARNERTPKDADMSHAIWTGSISFGLVTIPVKLLPAVRADEDVHFHYLHAKDQGRLKNIRTCEVCGKEIAWKDTVRGFEYAKGEYVVVDDDELKSMRPEATQAVEIQAFVDRTEIDPMLFDTPYYLEPEKNGRRAYALLRDSLAKKGKVGIAQVVLRTRAHLAALSPVGNALIVELLHYPHEIIPAKDIALPPAKEKTGAGELKAAEMLIDAMAKAFDPAEYKDDYEEKLRRALAARAHGDAPKRAKAVKPAKASNVVDLVELLQRSLKEPGRGKKAASPGARHAAPHRAGHAKRKAS